MGELAKYSGFKYELAIAETIEEIKLLETKAAAVADFAKRNKLGKDEQDQWGIFRTEIEAKKGAWLDEFFPSRVKSKGRKLSGTQTEPDKMPATKRESAQARLKIKVNGDF